MKKLDELLRLDGKAAIVTGGGKGIGYAISYRLAEAGAKVLIADVDETSANTAANELSRLGWSVMAVKGDVSNEADVAAMVEKCRTVYGSVDILVNNAGIYPNQPIASMSKEDFDKVMGINLRGTFLTTKHASDVMKQVGKGGKIINITSIDALHPSMIGLAHYDASKHGMWGFTKNSALELAPHKIWVNAIAPGGVATPGVAAMNTGQPAQPGTDPAAAVKAFLARIPMGRMGEPDEIGMVALFLASDMSAYMTGSQIVVDGGVLLV